MILLTLTVAKKELIHIIRDPRTLPVMFLIPLVQLVLLAYATTTDVGNLRTVVLDADRTPESRALVEAFGSSNYFEIAAPASDEQEMAQLVDGSKEGPSRVDHPGRLRRRCADRAHGGRRVHHRRVRSDDLATYHFER